MLTLALAAMLQSPVASAATPPPLAASGTVTVVVTGTDEATRGGDRPFADAVGQALGEANFTLVPPPGHSRYVAEVSVGREGKGVVAARAPTDRAQAGIGSWGPAVRVPLGSKKTQLHDLVLTTLTVRIVTAADRRPVWTGSAITAQADGTPGGAEPVMALKLARAVVAAYPHPLATPVSVP